MAKKKYGAEQIIAMLREAEVELPMFSQLGLWDQAKRLRLLNFKVSVLHIVSADA